MIIAYEKDIELDLHCVPLSFSLCLYMYGLALLHYYSIARVQLIQMPFVTIPWIQEFLFSGIIISNYLIVNMSILICRVGSI